jgi:hypothetical protein
MAVENQHYHNFMAKIRITFTENYTDYDTHVARTPEGLKRLQEGLPPTPFDYKNGETIELANVDRFDLRRFQAGSDGLGQKPQLPVRAS